MNITIISHLYPYSERSIFGIFVKDQADWLNMQHDITMVAPRPKTNKILQLLNRKWALYGRIPYQSNSSGGYKLIRPEYMTYPRKLMFSRIGKNFSKAVMNENLRKPDVFHVHYAYPDGCVVPFLKQRFPDTPIVLSVHGSDWNLNLNKTNIYSQIVINFQYADKIVAVSQKLKNSITTHIPSVADKVSVVHNGINIDDYPAARLTKKTNRKTKILTVGAFTKVKGIDILLKAVNNLRHEKFELTIVGKIPDKHAYNELCKLKKDLDLNTIVKFETEKDRVELAKYYDECDFFVLPSRNEGFGIVLIEAMLYGKPLISTYSGGPEEIVNETNGLLVNPGDVNQLSKAMKKMLSSFKNYDRKKIINELKEKYSHEIVMRELTRLYEELGNK